LYVTLKLTVSRMLRLLRSMRGVMQLLRTVYVSIPSLMNVGSLLFLLLFIYAVMGVSTFGTVRHVDTLPGGGAGLDNYANFNNWPMAMRTLARAMTGEEWHVIMQGCRIEPPLCSYELKDCGTHFAIAYFVSFVILVTLVMLNLFVAVILENFSDRKTGEEEESTTLRKSHVDAFLKAWRQVATNASGYMRWSSLHRLFRAIPPPLGAGHMATNSEVRARVAKLRIPYHDGGVVYYREVLLALTTALAGVEMPEGSMAARDLERLTLSALPSKQRATSAFCMLNEQLAAIQLQRAWRVKRFNQGKASLPKLGGRRRERRGSATADMVNAILSRWVGEVADGRQKERKRRASLSGQGQAAEAFGDKSAPTRVRRISVDAIRPRVRRRSVDVTHQPPGRGCEGAADIECGGSGSARGGVLPSQSLRRANSDTYICARGLAARSQSLTALPFGYWSPDCHTPHAALSGKHRVCATESPERDETGCGSPADAIQAFSRPLAHRVELQDLDHPGGPAAEGSG